MKNFGFAGYDRVVSIGTNGKMSEVAAAMGLTGLESLDEFVAANYRNYKVYQAELAPVSGLRLLEYDETERCNYQYITVEVVDASGGLPTRDQLVEILHAENVLARRYFYPGCHRMEPYRSHFPHAGVLLPETERLAARVMTLPTGTGIDPGDVARICAIIRFCAIHGSAVSERITKSSSHRLP
jgi:dTDP-4-amino-4,6-dideoxygalactose transaminase